MLWRTHVDQMPDEAQTITAVILNDIQACAVEAQRDGPALWTCVLDEFGAVIATAASQALALLQRARTHEGQVHVITQSLADIEALTGQVGLLASMADNFAAFIVHRQTAPESRDWAAKLMGTNALWQSTDQTSAYAATGAGSRRRVREFRVSSDAFAELAVGQAVVHTTLGPPPALCQVTPRHAARRDRADPARRRARRVRDGGASRHAAAARRQEDEDEDRGRTHRRRHDVRAAAAPRSRRRRPRPRPERRPSRRRPPAPTDRQDRADDV